MDDNSCRLDFLRGCDCGWDGAVNLLVMKWMGAYDSIGAKEFSAFTAQAGVGGKRSVFDEP
jgi:hypothetical protein